jgi:glycosyltransferase involved in cell wall biosynthesis
MCTSLVDAMAAARPAVASAVGGVPEVMADGETGFLVPPRDPLRMAEKIVLLLKDEERRSRMGAAALARARERFTAERMVEQTITIYEELLRAADTRPTLARP